MSTLQRPTGHQPAASKIARGGHSSWGSRPRGTRLPGFEAVDKLWEHERHPLKMVARQCLINKQAAHKQQEAAHCQCLLKEHAANECHEAAHKEAAHCQCLFDEEAARHLMAERTALA